MSVELPSTKPYLLRAIHEWCCDNGFTPYVSVVVDANTAVPKEHVKEGQIVLNIGADATGKLLIDNVALQCTARFNGAARELYAWPLAAGVVLVLLGMAGRVRRGRHADDR